MQGKATFTLTDARTGRTVKQLTEHNMVTEAAQRILNPPLYTMLNRFNYSGLIQGFLPLSQSVFGGIILLGNNLEESATNLMLNKDCIPIATAGGAYSGTNVMRGSLNQNESYATANGYHFTWDFGTDKANGTIKCAALTSRRFGDTGFSEEDTNGALMLNPVDPASSVSPTAQYFCASGQYVGTFSKLTHTFFKATNGTRIITFLKYKSLDPDSIGVNDSQTLSVRATEISSTDVALPLSFRESSRWFLNSLTRTMYLFSSVYLDGTQYKIDYAGISMNDFTVSDTGTVNLPYQISSQMAAALYNGKLFIANNGAIEVFSTNGTFISSHSVSLASTAIFFLVNDVLYFSNGKQLALYYLNGQFYRANVPGSFTYSYASDIKPPYYPTVYAYSEMTSSSLSSNPFICLAANFFSTINNLSEPIVKTSEHTLKITYDITN